MKPLTKVVNANTQAVGVFQRMTGQMAMVKILGESSFEYWHPNEMKRWLRDGTVYKRKEPTRRHGMLREWYCVIWINSHMRAYLGQDEMRCAEALEPGTCYGRGETEYDAEVAAIANANRIKQNGGVKNGVDPAGKYAHPRYESKPGPREPRHVARLNGGHGGPHNGDN